MQINWRSLLTEINVSWIDKGRNVSKGNVNISCPFCMNDPSYHLGIALNKEAYYCYRDPNRHSGRSAIRLLMRLGQGALNAERLISKYADHDAPDPFDAPQPIEEPPERMEIIWNRFESAKYDDRCLKYLIKRGFPSPRLVCERYDLRVAKEGTYANRLLMPLRINGEIKSFVGRAIYDHAVLRYLAFEKAGPQYVYSPNAARPLSDTLAIVEGPVDALKIAYACARLPIIVAALNGKHLGPDKLLQLRELGANKKFVIVSMDADVPLSSVYQMINAIAQAIRPPKIGRARLPRGYVDPGEMSAEDCFKWLNAARYKLAFNCINNHEML